MSNFILDIWHKADRAAAATARTRRKILKLAEDERMAALVKTGEIVKIEKNVPMFLNVNGHSICPGKYIAPFVCYAKDGTRTIVDPDAKKMRHYIHDLVAALYGVVIKETIG
jgi:hypothetical protein